MTRRRARKEDEPADSAGKWFSVQSRRWLYPVLVSAVVVLVFHLVAPRLLIRDEALISFEGKATDLLLDLASEEYPEPLFTGETRNVALHVPARGLALRVCSGTASDANPPTTRLDNVRDVHLHHDAEKFTVDVHLFSDELLHVTSREGRSRIVDTPVSATGEEVQPLVHVPDRDKAQAPVTVSAEGVPSGVVIAILGAGEQSIRLGDNECRSVVVTADIDYKSRTSSSYPDIEVKFADDDVPILYAAIEGAVAHFATGSTYLEAKYVPLNGAADLFVRSANSKGSDRRIPTFFNGSVDNFTIEGIADVVKVNGVEQLPLKYEWVRPLARDFSAAVVSAVVSVIVSAGVSFFALRRR